MTCFVLPGDEDYREVHPEEDESTTSSGSHRPQQEQNIIQWTVPGAQVGKRKRKTDHLESFLESYMQQKRQRDEADQKRRDEDKAVFENFIKMQQEAEERQFKAITELQQANSQLLLHMMGTFAKALLPRTNTPVAECVPATLTPSPFVGCPNDPPSGYGRPSPLPQGRHPVAATANCLPETSSSVLPDINKQVFDTQRLFDTCRTQGRKERRLAKIII